MFRFRDATKEERTEMGKLDRIILEEAWKWPKRLLKNY